MVIPTHGRETRLAFALEALAAQTLDPGDFEVIVVRDEGMPGPFAEAPAALAVRFLECGRPGVATKRNDGWRAASAPLIAFMDDDCRPAPGWLGKLLEAAGATENDPQEMFLQGRTEPDPDEAHLLIGLARSVAITGPTPWYETCNILYPRRLLGRVGGFDETFGLPPWGEDTDLGLRARRAGAVAGYADEALVWHAVHPRPLGGALREAARREHTPRILKRYPSYRRFLKLGVFANEAHAGLTLALTGLVLASAMRRGGPLLAAAAASPYLAHTFRNFLAAGPPTPRRVARLALHLPPQVTLDAVEVAATLRGAVRYRTLVI